MLLDNVFKLTVSNKVCKIFSFLLRRKRRREKRYIYTPFIYEPRKSFFYYKKFKANYQFVSLRVIKLFYVIFTFKQLRRIISKIVRKSGLFEQHFINFIECKLPFYLYRTGLFSTVFESLNFIKTQNV
jgi:ribosomal protein S4